jgi:nucleoside-diphosphate-sugar epimerase
MSDRRTDSGLGAGGWRETPDDTFQEDLEIVARASDLPLDELKGQTILVTGGTGYIGSALARTFLCMNRVLDLGLRIVLQVRSPVKAEALYGSLLERPELSVVICDLIGPNAEDSFVQGAASGVSHIDAIFHTASVTASKEIVARPVETIKTAVCGTSCVLDFAVKNNVKKVIYLSSMEVYGSVGDKIATESNLGQIDLTNVRSSYPESKRLCELLLISYIREYGLDCRIARLAQTFGAGVLETENRVFAGFAKSVIDSTDIILHTAGGTEGNYCYLRDALEGLLYILLRGDAGGVYNVANEENHSTVKSMAEMVARDIAGGRIGVQFDIPNSEETSAALGYAPDVRLRLSSAKLRSLGWMPKVGLKESFERMIATIRSGEAEYEQ